MNKAGRLIERTEHMDLIDANKQRITDQLALYHRRQAIVEHPYGVIKRQWGFYCVMTKRTIQHASADVGMIFIAYNLRRIFNSIDSAALTKYMRELCPLNLLLTGLLLAIFNATSLFDFSFHRPKKNKIFKTDRWPQALAS
jgi:hypothetical protein